MDASGFNRFTSTSKNTTSVNQIRETLEFFDTSKNLLEHSQLSCSDRCILSHEHIAIGLIISSRIRQLSARRSNTANQSECTASYPINIFQKLESHIRIHERST